MGRRGSLNGKKTWTGRFHQLTGDSTQSTKRLLPTPRFSACTSCFPRLFSFGFASGFGVICRSGRFIRSPACGSHTGLLATCAGFAWPTYKKFATVFAVFSATLAIVGIDAFIIEPSWLEVRHEKVVSAKVHKPIRLVVISDLQTDHVGDFERKVFQKTMEAKPDMVLLPGDYIQAYSAQYRDQVTKLRAILKELNVSAPLGVYATQGDSERNGWPEIFKDLPINPFHVSDTLVAGKNGPAEEEVVVTGLTLKDSWRLRYQIPHTDKFHIVVAHRPDFMLSAKEGDLFVAGHTHGGQVQLPIYGPLLTFSEAPRDWCGGCCVSRDDGKTFMITRGVGMERERAPRLRFFCHPEIVVIDVVPKA
jgi:predicted MPP superfamily phosphohydrolase